MAETEDPDVRAATAGEATPSTDELLELLRRERSDFLNYKRRTERERSEDRALVTGEVVQKLLPLVDELDRALSHLPPDLDEHPWAQGVALSRQRLMGALHDLGVHRVGEEGERFDPDTQEAVYFQPRSDADEARVSEVIRPGYRLGDRLLRPAQVVVTGPPHEAEAEPREEHRRSHRQRAA